MSTLSHAEKQKLLREKRQAKLKSSANARLNKITSSNSSFASTVSAVHAQQHGDNENETTDEVPPIRSTASNSKNRSNRISSILDAPPSFIDLKGDDVSEVSKKSIADTHHDDPEIADIENINTNNSSDSSPFGNNSSSDDIPNMNDIFKSLGQPNNLFDGFPGAGDSNGAAGDQDFFGQLLTNPNLASFMNGDGKSAPRQQQPPATRYSAYQSSQFKAWFLLLRLVLLTVLTAYSALNYKTRLFFSEAELVFDNVSNSGFFYRYFLTLELALISGFIFYTNNTTYQFQYDSVVGEGLLSMGGLFLPPVVRGSLQALNKYYQLFKFFFVDVSYVLFLLYLFSIFA